MEPDEFDGGAAPSVEETLETLVEMSPANPLDVTCDVVELLRELGMDEERTVNFLRRVRDVFA